MSFLDFAILHFICRLTAGEDNNLIHYVHFDSTEGVLLCPPSQVQSTHLQHVLNNFRNTAQLIHELLQNTVRFKVSDKT